MAYLWLTASVLVFGVGEYLSKMWSLKPSLSLALLTAIPYACGTWLWLPALKHDNKLSTIGTAWSVMSALTTVAIGMLMFQERLNVWNFVGVALALASLVLLQV